MRFALIPALVFALGGILCGCSDQPTTAAAQADPAPTVEPSQPPPPRPPAWAYLAVGTRAYTRAYSAELIGRAFVCANITDFRNEGGNCPAVRAGRLVTIHTVRLGDAFYGGREAIYVDAKGWTGGLIPAANLVAVVPKGTVIVCPDHDSGWTLRGHDYERLDGVDLRGSPFKAVVRHTLEPEETQGPAVHILSGPGSGKDGYLSFDDLSNCKIDGTGFEPNFDWFDYEHEQGPYEVPEPASGQ